MFYITEPLTQNDDQALAKIFTDSESKRHFWHGEDPDPNDEGFPVYNLELVNPHPGDPPYRFLGRNGAIGLACLDESDPEADRYRIVTLESSSGLVMFRLEEELLRGESAEARIVDPGSLRTRPGETITVSDDQRKWFGPGSPAPSGDYGNDPRGSSALGWAAKALAEGSGGPSEAYSIVSMGTWYRWIKGELDGEDWSVSADSVVGWDGDCPRSDAGTTTGTISLDGICTDPAGGLVFIAVFNEITLKYQVITICCPTGDSGA
jgi:hypothetical protein